MKIGFFVSEDYKKVVEIECVDNYKMVVVDIRIFVLNFNLFFVRDDIYVFSIFKNSFFDSFVCIFEKSFLGYNKSIFFAMSDLGKAYKNDNEVNVGKMVFIFFMLEIGKTNKRDVELNIMKYEVVFFMLYREKVCKVDFELNSMKVELEVNVFVRGSVY